MRYPNTLYAALCTITLGCSAPGAGAQELVGAETTENWTNEQDHRNMLEQLGIERLRPGANGWAKAGEANAANYDAELANPFGQIPDPLLMQNGEPVLSEVDWWAKRRPEIAEIFESEVYGRIPEGVPGVVWEIDEESNDGRVGGRQVMGKRLLGKVDNSGFPQLSVTIEMTLVVPMEAEGPVPVLIMFTPLAWPLPNEAGLVVPKAPWPQPETDVPPSPVTLIQKGWGYAFLNTQSIQADNGASLTKGIIGLANKGKPRTPEQWGALRAWAWGASRAIDYLETDSRVDSSRIGIEGVSRYGKAALVAMAFEPRFAMGLIGSSGKGGVALHKRDFGEAVENLTSSGAYHWMAGNYLKYGAEDSAFGRKDASDLPVDSHELIALCAPRLTFISYGIPEMGDSLWLDQQGSFMATVAAGPVFRLLGATGIGVEETYDQAVMPEVNHGLLDGKLAWRQHDGGHEDRSNMGHFIDWAEEKWK